MQLPRSLRWIVWKPTTVAQHRANFLVIVCVGVVAYLVARLVVDGHSSIAVYGASIGAALGSGWHWRRAVSAQRRQRLQRLQRLQRPS